jgi:hypothetical protein
MPPRLHLYSLIRVTMHASKSAPVTEVYFADFTAPFTHAFLTPLYRLLWVDTAAFVRLRTGPAKPGGLRAETAFRDGFQ